MKCLIYSRVSSFSQNNESAFEDLKKLAEFNGDEIIAMFGEKVSGFNPDLERQVYEEMKQFAKDNHIKKIYIWEISRLGRNTRHTLNEIEYFRNEGIDLYFKKENLHTLNPSVSDTLQLNLLASIAELERSSIVERTNRGKIRSAEQGKIIHLGMMPYGYQGDEKGYLKINEAEAPIIKMIYEMKISGHSARGIATHLNSIGIPTRYKTMNKNRINRRGETVSVLWRTNSIINILRNPIYKGDRKHKDKFLTSPAIVSPDVWIKVQKTFEDNVSSLGKTKYEYLLKTKIECGHCGRKWLSGNMKRDGYSYFLYSCSGKGDALIRCKAGQFKSQTLDQSVYQLLFRHHKIMHQLRNESIDQKEIEIKNKQIEYYQSEVKKLERQLKRNTELYRLDEINQIDFETFNLKNKRHIDQLKNTIVGLQGEIDSKKNIDESLSDNLKNLYHETNFEIKRQTILKYLNKVVAYKVKNKIDWGSLTYWNLGIDSPIPKKVIFNPPDAHDKIIYIELYAFDFAKPIKAIISSKSANVFSSEGITYRDGIVIAE
jgi:site-specific DNA recombinase